MKVISPVFTLLLSSCTIPVALHDTNHSGSTPRPIYHNGQCLDISGNDHKSTIIYPCHGKANQLFASTQGQITQNNKCLDVAGDGKKDGTPVIAYACHGKANQHWHKDGRQIRSQSSGKCLTNAGGKAVISTCQNHPNQWFSW